MLDDLRRDEWLKDMETRDFKSFTKVGPTTSLADVERWLLAALGRLPEGNKP